MRAVVDETDVVLGPGELWFGDDRRVVTLLGSCVAITFWHPRTRAGGMCHFLLPSRAPSAGRRHAVLDGRYADEAVPLMLAEIARRPGAATEYEVKMFGGGNQFDRTVAGSIDVPRRNVDAGLRLLRSQGLSVRAQHLGGNGPRHVSLDLRTGEVWVRHRTIACGSAR